MEAERKSGEAVERESRGDWLDVGEERKKRMLIAEP